MASKHFWNRRRFVEAVAIIAVVTSIYVVARPSMQGTLGAPANELPKAAQRRPAPNPPEGPANYLHTSGSKILDAQGNEVRLTGVNWFGLETGTFSPHGLWERNWEDMLDQIADLGYNTIRLPYSDQLFEPLSLPEGIDYLLNPDLRGLNGLQVMDKIIEGAGRRGLKIILDRHRPDIEKQTNLWYSERYDEQRWIDDWKLLAARYLGNDTVIAADLHNEPHNAYDENSKFKSATWGDANPKTDWRLAAEKAGNAILSVNPNWLIIVEGIETYDGNWYWWGGNLMGAAKAPVRLNVPDRLVYSAHDYGPGVWTQPWFKDAAFPANLPAMWSKHWGFLAEQGIAPILMGEFGGRRSDNDTLEGKWQNALIAYLKDKGMSYTYWAFNANSGDTGGILDEEDDRWATIDQGKQNMLAAYQAPKIASGQYKQINLAAAPSYGDETEKRAVLYGDLRVLFHTGDVYRPGDPLLPGMPGAKAPMLQPQIRLLNVGPAPLPLQGLELRYWFSDPLAEDAHKPSLYWTSIGKADVKAAVVGARDGDQNHYLKITFDSEAGSVLGKGGTVDIQSRIVKTDGTAYEQAEDFSFDHSRDADHLKDFQPNERIGLYQNGKLIWGTEPQAR